MSMTTWRRSSAPSIAVKSPRDPIRLSASSAGMFGCLAWVCILSLLCALILQKQMAFAVSETSRSHVAVSIGRLENSLHLLSRKFEHPRGYLATSSIPFAPQKLCCVSGRACTPNPSGLSGHLPREIHYVRVPLVGRRTLEKKVCPAA